MFLSEILVIFLRSCKFGMDYFNRRSLKLHAQDVEHARNRVPYEKRNSVMVVKWLFKNRGCKGMVLSIAL